MKRVLFTLFAFALGLVASACLGPALHPVQPELQGQASLSVQAMLPAHLAGPETTIELILRQDTRELHFDLPYEGESVTFAVDGLYEGAWEATLQIVDDDGDVTFLANSEVLLFDGRVTHAELELVPAPGWLEVYIDLGTFEHKDDVGRARVSVTPGGYSSSVREEGADMIRIEREVMPRTYDFRVTLYSDNYTSEYAIYNSPWEPVTIYPGKVTTVVWTVSTGELRIVGQVFPSPGAPQDFRVEPTEDGDLRFTWEPGPYSEYAVGYRIYERNAPFTYYRQIHEVEADTLHWVMDTSRITTPQTRAYAVAAISEVGLESPRTEPIVIEFPIDSK